MKNLNTSHVTHTLVTGRSIYNDLTPETTLRFIDFYKYSCYYKIRICTKKRAKEGALVMVTDTLIRSIGTVFEARLKDDIAAVSYEVTHGRTVRCGKDSYLEFGKWFTCHIWMMPDLTDEIARQLEDNPQLHHGKIIRRYWGNGRIFTWRITEKENIGMILRLDFRGEARTGLLEKLSWWWLARTA